jgi:hypothetical protein
MNANEIYDTLGKTCIPLQVLIKKLEHVRFPHLNINSFEIFCVHKPMCQRQIFPQVFSYISGKSKERKTIQYKAKHGIWLIKENCGDFPSRISGSLRVSKVNLN